MDVTHSLGTEDFENLQPKFSAIENYLAAARERSEESSDDYIVAIMLMEEVVDEVQKIQGKSLRETVKERVEALAPAEKAAVLGGLGAGALSMLSVTGLGGFRIAAGGTAFGVAGIASAAVATGGVGLAGAAGLYVLYRGGSAALNTEMGQSASKRVQDAAQNAADFFKRKRRDQDAE